MDLIKRGAQAGHGEYLAIVSNNSVSKKIIGLLEYIIKPKLTNFEITYDTNIFDKEESSIPTKISKGKPNNIYLKLKPLAGTVEEVLNSNQTYLNIAYLDEQKNEKVSQKFSLKPTSVFEELNKFYYKNQITELLQSGTKPENRAKAIKLSIDHQILCRGTAFLCKIKEKKSEDQSKISYYMKMKTALEGKSLLSMKDALADIYIKTLTGKTVTISGNLLMTVMELKQGLQ